MTSSGDDPGPRGRVRELAARLLASGVAGTPAPGGELLDPLPIRSPGGEPAGWWVGLGAGGKLLGFLQLDEALRFRRFSSFQRRPGDLASCPALADWTDPALIRERARAHAAPDDRLSAPFLSFDANPDRIAWAVPATGPHGEQKVIFVAGNAVYVAP
jgi:hypothetical protein